jgi:hypothetical protein
VNDLPGCFAYRIILQISITFVTKMAVFWDIAPCNLIDATSQKTAIFILVVSYKSVMSLYCYMLTIITLIIISSEVHYYWESPLQKIYIENDFDLQQIITKCVHCKIERNCHFPTVGQNCMTYRHALLGTSNTSQVSLHKNNFNFPILQQFLPGARKWQLVKTSGKYMSHLLQQPVTFLVFMVFVGFLR